MKSIIFISILSLFQVFKPVSLFSSSGLRPSFTSKFHGIVPIEAGDPPSELIGRQRLFLHLDINGDGLDDVIVFYTNSGKAYIECLVALPPDAQSSENYLGFRKVSKMVPENGYNFTSYDDGIVDILTDDINNDGSIDIIVATRNKGLLAFPNNYGGNDVAFIFNLANPSLVILPFPQPYNTIVVGARYILL